MAIDITGAERLDGGPQGCVARFILAGDMGDTEAAMAELHPDSRDGLAGGVSSPPGITSAAIGEPIEADGIFKVPTELSGPDGQSQRFIFVVRPTDGGLGIDLEASMKETFGMDPMEMMESAMRAVAEPIAGAMEGLGEAIGSALGGGGFGHESGPTPRRIAADETIETVGFEPPPLLHVRVEQVDLRRSVQRSADGNDYNTTTELDVRCAFDMPPGCTVTATKGVVLDVATSLDGDDLRHPAAHAETGAESYSSWEREAGNYYFRLPLLAPERPLRGIAEMSGIVRVEVQAGEFLEIVLDPVGEIVGRSVSLPALGAEIAFDRDENGSLVIRSPYGWFDTLSDFFLVDAAGDKPGDSWSGSGDGETTTRTYYSEVPDDARFVIRFMSFAGVVEMSFMAQGMPFDFEAGRSA